MDDPVDILEDLFKRRGHDLDLRGNEVDRYFIFDLLTDPDDLALAWSQFPAHEAIRARAAQVDAVSDIVSVFGYRTPKPSNRCSDAELERLVRGHVAAIRPLLQESYGGVTEFIDKGFEVRIVGSDAGDPPPAQDNDLFMSLYDALSDFKLEHLSLNTPIIEVLYDWAVFLTKCNEVVFYLLWPAMEDCAGIDPRTPDCGFGLWLNGCRTRFWIKDSDPASGVVHVRPPWTQ